MKWQGARSTGPEPDLPRTEGGPEVDTEQRRLGSPGTRRTTKEVVARIGPAHEQTAWPRHERVWSRRDR